MPKLKEGVIVRPFGPASKLEGEVSQPVADWLTKKGLVTAESFEPEVQTGIDAESAKKAAEEAAEAKAKADAEPAAKPAPKRPAKKTK